MQDRMLVFARLGVLCVLALSGQSVSAQEKAAPSTAQVHVVITDMALRSDSGGVSAMDSPYLSLISVVKGWPQQNVRREVLMVSDGIDRLRGEKPTGAQLGPGFGIEPIYHSMPTISQDAVSASEISQRYNVIVNSIYSPGVGRAGRVSARLRSMVYGKF